MTRSLILDTVTRAGFPLVLAFSLYLLFVGHNAPGGGFVAGLTAGIAFVLVYVGGGVERLRSVVRFDPEILLAAGLLAASVTGLTSLLLGEAFLTSAILKWTLPVLGEVKLVTVLFFDIGVYLIVVGLALSLLEILGVRSEAAADETPAAAAARAPGGDGG